MSSERVERRLAAILAADVAGSCRLIGIDEEGTLAQLKALRTTLFDPKITDHHGRVVKNTGDGALVEFGSVVDAVRCAVEVQRGVAEQNADVPQVRRIEFRIGVHVGDIIIDGNDIFGDGVNIAVRLEGIAEPGGVCVSDDAHRQIRGKVDIAFDDMGPQALKNIAEPMRAWRMQMSKVLPLAFRKDFSISRSFPLALPDKPSIAVLPFHNIGGDPKQEYFADGIVEDIITALSRFKSLFVIARNSSFTYKGKPIDFKQIGRELGVRYVLGGSVRKASGRMRITGRLIEAATGACLWADKFDGELKDAFELQDSVTTSVVGSIAPRLVQADMETVKRKPPNSWNSYDHNLRGLTLMLQYTSQSTQEALGEFRKSIDLDPTFGLAYARAALCIRNRRAVLFEPLADEEVSEALRLAARATELEPDDEAVMAICAFVFASLSDEFERAGALADRAVALNPNLASAWSAKGWMSLYLRDPSLSLEAFGRAIRLNPLDPFLLPNILFGYACAGLLSGEYEDGLGWANQLLAVSPEYLLGLVIFVGNAALAGRLSDAEDTAARIRNLYPHLRGSYLRLMFRARKPEHMCKLNAMVDRIGLPE